MKIALTGGSGGIGRAIIEQALRRGHSVVSIDRVAAARERTSKACSFVPADIDRLRRSSSTPSPAATRVIHMAAIPSPVRHPDHVVHNNNVVGSYNALRAAVEHGIMRICQASSVNAIGLSYSRDAALRLLPARRGASELHRGALRPVEVDLRAAGRHLRPPLRGHAHRQHALPLGGAGRASWRPRHFNVEHRTTAKHLWPIRCFDAAARACLLSLDGRFTGHEAFYIVGAGHHDRRAEPRAGGKVLPRMSRFRAISAATSSFFSSAKAERLLGWKHNV